MNAREADIAARWWGSEHHADPAACHWTSLPAVERRVNRAISGEPAKDWLGYVLGHHLEGLLPVGECLSLGCGSGAIERALVDAGAITKCLALDLSEGQLERARRLAEAPIYQGIEYRRADLNRLDLPERRFDLVLASMSLHHVHELEHLAEQINRCLTPTGVFAAVEYVGPNRLQLPPRQVELFEAALRLLPSRYRESVSWRAKGAIGGDGPRRSTTDWLRLLAAKLRGGSLLAAVRRNLQFHRLRSEGGAFVKTAIPSTRGTELAVLDPTEAVRSADILPVLFQRLDVQEVRTFGSALLMLVLDDIAGNFRDDDPKAQALLEMLFEIDDALLGADELHPDFVFIAARGRRNGYQAGSA
jgi:SAM-dependent methyltransferase